MTDTLATGAGPEQCRAGSLFERLVKRIGRAMLPSGLAGGIEVCLPSGNLVQFRSHMAGPLARLDVHSWRVLVRAIQAGANGFAESYIRGEVDSPDLVALVRFFARNKKLLHKTGGLLFTSRLTDRVRHRRRANTRSGSKRNIAAHYDLSNAFFSRWLDNTMTYSSARFSSTSETLQQAQVNKYRQILAALDVSGSDSILEIGCGWGGFAAEALPGTDFSYTGITLSNEQLHYARNREDLNRTTIPCKFRLQDYRDTTGQFDAIVSIEMIEAVGKENWYEYFSILRERLKPGGHAIIQSIVIQPEHYGRYRRKPDFIQLYIFPGGMLPTVDLLRHNAKRAGLTCEVLDTFPQDYASTLCLWRERFEQSWPEIQQLGFDENFRRMWRYYLAYCEAAFAEEVISVGIYRFSRPAVGGHP